MSEHTTIEQIQASGGVLLDTVRQMIHEGNVRRIVIKHNNQAIVEFPLTVGVVGVVLAPVLAAVGTLAALATECTIEVERVVPRPPADGE